MFKRRSRSLTVLEAGSFISMGKIHPRFVFPPREHVWKSLEGHACSVDGYTPRGLAMLFFFRESREDRQNIKASREWPRALQGRTVLQWSLPRREYRTSRRGPLEDVFENVGASVFSRTLKQTALTCAIDGIITTCVLSLSASFSFLLVSSEKLFSPPTLHFASASLFLLFPCIYRLLRKTLLFQLSRIEKFHYFCFSFLRKQVRR